MKKTIGTFLLHYILFSFPSLAMAEAVAAPPASPASATNLATALAATSPTTSAKAPIIAIVNVNALYEKSVFVKNANKTLQANVKKMETQLQGEKSKLQSKVTEYEQASTKNTKQDLAKKITEEQAQLTKMTQEFQQKIQKEQNEGMQKFTQIVQTAVAEVAKEKRINIVLNSNSLLYADSSWVNITDAVQAAMPKN